MTCEEIRELILLLPLDEYAPSTRTDIEKHAERCVGCRTVLRMESSLAAVLRELPEVPTPSGTADVVLSRIAAVDEQRGQLAAGPARSSATRGTGGTWAVFTGLAVALGVYFQAAFGGQVWLELLLPIVGFGRENVFTGGYSLAFAVGLGVYLTGLFAATRSRE